MIWSQFWRSLLEAICSVYDGIAPLKNTFSFMRVGEHQRAAGRSEETTEILSARCDRESFSCLNPPSKAAGADGPLGGWSHRKATECWMGQQGAAKSFPVEVGFRGFVAWRMSDKPSSCSALRGGGGKELSAAPVKWWIGIWWALTGSQKQIMFQH